MRWISILLVLFMLAGCTTMRPVDAGNWSNLVGQVEVGDTVEVNTRDGQSQRFVVTQVTADALVGADTRIAQADIVTLKVKAVHRGRVVAGSITGGLMVLLVVLVTATASLLQ